MEVEKLIGEMNTSKKEERTENLDKGCINLNPKFLREK